MKYLIALATILTLTACGADASEQEEMNSGDDSEYTEEQRLQDWADSVVPIEVTLPDGSTVSCVIYPGVNMECFE